MPDLAKPLIILHSPSFVLKRRELQRLREELLRDEDPEYALEQYWAGDDKLDLIAAAVTSVSLLSDTRLVMVHELQALPAKEQRPLVKPLENIPPGTTVVVTTAPRNDKDKKPPVTSELLKLANRIGTVRELPVPKEQALPGWVSQEVALYGKQIERQAAQLLVDTSGHDVDRLANEIAKLMTYTGHEPLVTVEHVQAASSAMDDRNVFALVDAIGHRDAPLATDIIKALIPPGSRPGAALGILGMIGRQVRLLWQAVHTLKTRRSLSDIPPDIAAHFPSDPSLASAHSFVREKLSRQARNFTEPQLARALVRIYETDMMLKGMGDEKADERTVLELLVVSLCRK